MSEGGTGTPALLVLLARLKRMAVFYFFLGGEAPRALSGGEIPFGAPTLALQFKKGASPPEAVCSQRVFLSAASEFFGGPGSFAIPRLPLY